MVLVRAAAMRVDDGLVHLIITGIVLRWSCKKMMKCGLFATVLR